MRQLLGIVATLVFACTPCGAAHGQSTRAQLDQLVGQLQKGPTDNSLREQIIRLAQDVKPAPAAPEEAERHMAYGMAAFKGAKSLADYKDAVKEFEQATHAAPWWGDAYYNLGVAQDKAEQYDDALASLKLAQLASPGSKDIKDLTYQVEYRSKRASSPQALREKKVGQPQKEFVGLIQRLDGAVFFGEYKAPGVVEDIEIRIHRDEDNNYLECSTRHKEIQSNDPRSPVTGQWINGEEMYITPETESEFSGCMHFARFRISPDSRTLYSLHDDGSSGTSYQRQ